MNPSWLAVELLHDVVISVDPSSNPDGQTVMFDDPSPIRPIHISVLQIPVSYEAVLDIVPGLHARPPVLPKLDTSFPPPPEKGYDFIFHIGVAGRGPLRMEKLGHKLGYHMKDADGKLAPIVRTSPKDFSRRPDDPSPAENLERERLSMDMVESGGDTAVRPARGFGSAYENFPDELPTDIDVTRLVQDLKHSGIEVHSPFSPEVAIYLTFARQQIYTSMDAGHYLCDFIYYCSLAEAKRTAKPYEKRRNTQVLFLHCPPVGQPLSAEEVTDAIKRIIVWICGELQLLDETASDDDGVARA